MKLRFFLSLPLIFFGQVSIAQNATCYMEIEGTTYIEGPCLFEPSGGGSFRISTIDDVWFADVGVLQDGYADGWWNGDRPDDSGEYYPMKRAHSRLGVMTRDDACWNSSTVSICAW